MSQIIIEVPKEAMRMMWDDEEEQWEYCFQEQKKLIIKQRNEFEELKEKSSKCDTRLLSMKGCPACNKRLAYHARKTREWYQRQKMGKKSKKSTKLA